MSKLRLGFSPYMYARVSAMKGLLLKPEEYDRLMKMGPHEIVRFLLDSAQYPEIIDIAKGTRAVEAALNTHLSSVFSKLHRIADPKMRQVIGVYLLRFDMENIKMIVRSKFAGIDQKEIKALLYPSVNYSLDFFANLLAKTSAQDVVDALSFIKKKASDKLFEVENILDRYYVENVLEFANNLGRKGEFIAQFMREEIDVINIRTILRLRLENMTKNEIVPYLISPSSLVMKLVEKREIGGMVELLRRKKRTILTGEEKDLMERLEIDLDISLLKKESLLMHKNPLSVDQLLGFMFAKEIEVRNLKILIKGKQLEISQEYMERLLVVPS